eukprot:gene36570-43577_t
MSVVVFEKSHGLGGRMATRRTPFGTFDHGAQYFTARNDDFVAVVDDMRASGDSAAWFPEAFVGTPTMNAPAKMLLEGVEIALGCEVPSLVLEGSRWRLVARDDAAAALRDDGSDAVGL